MLPSQRPSTLFIKEVNSFSSWAIVVKQNCSGKCHKDYGRPFVSIFAKSNSLSQNLILAVALSRSHTLRKELYSPCRGKLFSNRKDSIHLKVLSKRGRKSQSDVNSTPPWESGWGLVLSVIWPIFSCLVLKFVFNVKRFKKVKCSKVLEQWIHSLKINKSFIEKAIMLEKKD